jgi:hypothetical protein
LLSRRAAMQITAAMTNKNSQILKLIFQID